jgi:cystathionine beta-lyase
MKERLDHPVFGYHTEPEDYRPSICDWVAHMHQWDIQPNWLRYIPGIVKGIGMAINALLKQDDKIIIQPPVYHPFRIVPQKNNHEVVFNPLRELPEGGYEMDFDNLEEVCDEKCKMLILANPHNPAGITWPREALEKLASFCHKKGIIVISDEIHCDFCFPEHPHTPFAKACPELADSVIVCTAPSKTFNLAGLQVSNILIPGEQLQKQFKREMDIVAFHDVNRLGAVAATAAYQGGEAWLGECKAYLRRNLDYLRDFLETRLPKIKLVEPEGTYLAWLDCSGLGLTKEQLDDLVINKANLWLDTGSIFGECAEQFQRIVLACPRATLEKAMEQLANAVNGL